MKTIRKISEDEMIAIFLEGELSSERFGGDIQKAIKRMNIPTTTVTKLNIHDSKQNEQRRDLLGEIRGYGKNKKLFENFPQELDWEVVELTKEEMSSVKYIDYSYWVELSDSTRIPSVAARNIKDGKEIYDVPNDGFTSAADYISKGGDFPPMIFVTTSSRDKIVVLEGHKRLTAYFLVPEHIPETIQAIMGVGDDINMWDLF